jgi:hypothetical protein
LLWRDDIRYLKLHRSQCNFFRFQHFIPRYEILSQISNEDLMTKLLLVLGMALSMSSFSAKAAEINPQFNNAQSSCTTSIKCENAIVSCTASASGSVACGRDNGKYRTCTSSDALNRRVTHICCGKDGTGVTFNIEREGSKLCDNFGELIITK